MSSDLATTRAAPLLAKLQPFLVATPYNLPFLDTAPFGAAVAPGHVIDPLRTESEVFLDLLQIMDALTFGLEGMPMSRWVFYDGSELPGGIFGLGLPAADVPAEVRASYEIPGDWSGLVPFSMYIAIPTPSPGAWFGHNLASLNPVFPDLGLRGLGTVTKALALKAFRAKVQVGATQWDSAALFIHTRFGPLELETAWTPAHSEPETLTYRVACTDNALLAALGAPSARIDRPEPERWIRSDDPGAMHALHLRIEAGERCCIPATPRTVGRRGGLGGRVLEVPISPLPGTESSEPGASWPGAS